MTALDRDPLRALWDALERAGCDPHGDPHRFHARCPAHDDRAPSLAVSVGADGRALTWCHGGCPTERVIAALNLRWGDLFPAGHRHGHALPVLAKERRYVDIALEAFRELGIRYRPARDAGMWSAEKCPACKSESPYALLVHEDERGAVTFSCANGCGPVDVLRELVGAQS